jgi:hypothetical protein
MATAPAATSELIVHLPDPHGKQVLFIDSHAKRKVVRAGRRSGKTVGIAIYAVEQFLAGKRILYATPTSEQVDRFWKTVTQAMAEPIDNKILYKNETEHIVEVPKTEQRIRAKTAWNADTLRGDYADELIMDEYQLMDEDAWGVVGAPMLLDNNGNATFIYTPPSLHSRSASKARDPQHAAKLYKRAQQDKTGRWATFHFTSMDNPYISTDALDEITTDMTALAYRQEILAEDVDEAPGALWKRKNIDDHRVIEAPEFDRIVVAIDPSATSTGDEAGIIVAGKTGEDFYPIADESLQGSPLEWAQAAITAYHKYKADCIVAEVNQGGEMVELTIKTIPEARNIRISKVNASRGKQTRAEPVAAVYEQGRGHHVGRFDALEDELCLWVPGDPSPNRMDALVWAAYELGLGGGEWVIS